MTITEHGLTPKEAADAAWDAIHEYLLRFELTVDAEVENQLCDAISDVFKEAQVFSLS